MDPRFLRNLAQQARNLLPVARTDFARAQPRIWIAEFDSLAQITERDALTARLCSIDPSGGAPSPRSTLRRRKLGANNPEAAAAPARAGLCALRSSGRSADAS